MNALFDTYSLLRDELCRDPLFCLAAATSWLDPLWLEADTDDDEPDELRMALMITRQAFPDLYAAAVELLRVNAPYRDLDHLICRGFSERGIPLDNLDMMIYGIPLQAVGIELNNPETYYTYPELMPLLELFGVTIDQQTYIDIPEQIYTTGRSLSESLVQHEDEPYRQIGWMLAWTFSCSDNSLIDFDDETLAEIPPLTWEQNDLDFAIELIREADDIMGHVRAGFDLLENNNDLLHFIRDKLVHKPSDW